MALSELVCVFMCGCMGAEVSYRKEDQAARAVCPSNQITERERERQREKQKVKETKSERGL